MAFLTDASYLKSLEDYMMENNHLKDSPVEKHVEDDRNKKKISQVKGLRSLRANVIASSVNRYLSIRAPSNFSKKLL